MEICEKYGWLPVSSVAGQVNESLLANPRLVVTAPPGAGKSTLLPLSMLEGHWRRQDPDALNRDGLPPGGGTHGLYARRDMRTDCGIPGPFRDACVVADACRGHN